MVVAVNFWDLAMYTKHGLGLQPHLNEALLMTWRRDFGDLLSMAQVGKLLSLQSRIQWLLPVGGCKNGSCDRLAWCISSHAQAQALPLC